MSRDRLVHFACLAGCAAATLSGAWISGCGDSGDAASSTSAASTSSGGTSTGASGSSTGTGGAGGSPTGTGGEASTSASSSTTASSSSSGTGGAGPVGVIVTAAGHPAALAVDASGLYWSDAVTGDVKRAALDGSNVTTLALAAVAPADLRGLVLGATDVYLAAAPNPTGGIRKVPKAGGAVTTAASSPSVTALTALNGVPYWGDSAGGSIASLNGTLSYGIWKPTTVAADPSGVYWTEDTLNIVRRVSLDGSMVSTMAIKVPGAELGGVANGLVYFAHAGAIHTVPITGGAPPADVVMNANPHFLTPTMRGLYWVEDAPAMMPRPIKALATGATTPVELGTAIETSGLAVGQGYIYWASGVDGTIAREKEL